MYMYVIEFYCRNIMPSNKLMIKIKILLLIDNSDPIGMLQYVTTLYQLNLCYFPFYSAFSHAGHVTFPNSS